MEVKKENIGKADILFHTRLFHIPHFLEFTKRTTNIKKFKLNQLEVRTRQLSKLGVYFKYLNVRQIEKTIRS